MEAVARALAPEGSAVGRRIRVLAPNGRVGLVIDAVASVGPLLAIANFGGLDALTIASIGVAVAAGVAGFVLLAVFVAARRAVKQDPSAALHHA